LFYNVQYKTGATINKINSLLCDLSGQLNPNGLPPALLQPFVGKHKCANGKLLDEFGDNLILTNMAGDGWRKRHDVFKWGLSRWMPWAKMEYTCEVYGLFAAYIKKESDRCSGVGKRAGTLLEEREESGH